MTSAIEPPRSHIDLDPVQSSARFRARHHCMRYYFAAGSNTFDRMYLGVVGHKVGFIIPQIRPVDRVPSGARGLIYVGI
jgi:hypothetical protein